MQPDPQHTPILNRHSKCLRKTLWNKLNFCNIEPGKHWPSCEWSQEFPGKAWTSHQWVVSTNSATVCQYVCIYIYTYKYQVSSISIIRSLASGIVLANIVKHKPSIYKYSEQLSVKSHAIYAFSSCLSTPGCVYGDHRASSEIALAKSTSCKWSKWWESPSINMTSARLSTLARGKSLNHEVPNKTQTWYWNIHHLYRWCSVIFHFKWFSVAIVDFQSFQIDPGTSHPCFWLQTTRWRVRQQPAEEHDRTRPAKTPPGDIAPTHPNGKPTGPPATPPWAPWPLGTMAICQDHRQKKHQAPTLPVMAELVMS